MQRLLSQTRITWTLALTTICLSIFQPGSCHRYSPFQLTEQKLKYAGVNLTELASIASTALTIDAKDPPFIDTEHTTEPTCLIYKASCGETSFWERKEMSSGLNVTEITVVPTYGPVHAHRMRKPMKFTDAIVEADVRSIKSGWRVTGELSAGLALGQKDRALATIGLKLASETREEVIRKHESRVNIQREILCDPGHQCWSELWTFAATVRGACNIRHMVRCAGETVDICRQTGWDLCSQYADYKTRACGEPLLPPTYPSTEEMLWTGMYRRSSAPDGSVPCEVQFPLTQANGRPYQLSLGFENKLEDLSDDEHESVRRRRFAQILEESDLRLLYVDWV